MAFDYTKAAATALRLIANFGLVGEIRAYNGTFDGVAGTVSDEYTSTAATLVTVPSVDSLIRFDDQFRESLVLGKARVFLVAANGLDFDPAPGNCILHEGQLWEIGSGPGQGGVMPLNPAGTPVMFICGCMAGGRNPFHIAFEFLSSPWGGTYLDRNTEINGKASYLKLETGDFGSGTETSVYWSGTRWNLWQNGTSLVAHNSGDTETPPETGWTYLL